MPDGAEQAFAALVQENADMLRAYLLAVVRDPALADELFHEIFLAAWKKFNTYDSDRSFGTWLRNIAASTLMNKKRHVSSDKIMYFDQETLALLEVQFSKTSRKRGDKWSDKITAIGQCLDALPKPALDLVSLFYHKNYNCREISNRLGMEPAVVKKRLQRSRKVLSDCVHSKLGRKYT